MLQIPESRWDTISLQIKSLLSASSRSSKPAIYGAAAAIEIKRLRPLAETGKLQVLCKPEARKLLSPETLPVVCLLAAGKSSVSACCPGSVGLLLF